MIYKAGAALGLSPVEIREASLAEILTLWSAKHEAMKARSGAVAPMTQGRLQELVRNYPDD